MTHLDIELKILKEELAEMHQLVFAQLNKAKVALLTNDRELAREVNFNERRVNSLELTIDKDCENIFALFNPVAIDLRFVLACLKINSNLERIGDIADGIARYVKETAAPFDDLLLKESRLLDMFDIAISILDDVHQSFVKEDTKIARKVFQKDDLLDEINLKANSVIEKFIKAHPESVMQCLHIISTIRKLERVGDQSKNIAEEVIFYIEAKILKHKPDKEKAKSN